LLFAQACCIVESIREKHTHPTALLPGFHLGGQKGVEPSGRHRVAMQASSQSLK
jgi:hypothetical protein